MILPDPDQRQSLLSGPDPFSHVVELQLCPPNPLPKGVSLQPA